MLQRGILQGKRNKMTSDRDMAAGLNGQKVLVTGASGFIGLRLVTALCAAGAVVTVLGRTRHSLAKMGALPVRFIQAGLAENDKLAGAIAGQDILFSLAYDVRAPAAANLAGFDNLLRAAQTAGVARIIHISSIVVYDGWPGGAITETSPMTRPGGSPYRQAKIVQEHRLMTSPLPAAILQPTIVWGPGSSLWTDGLAEALLAGAVLLPDPEGLCQGVFVDDVVQACLRAATLPDLGRERFIINGPAPFAWSALLMGYASHLGRGEVRWLPAAELAPVTKPSPDAMSGPSLAARISAAGRAIVGSDRFEALVRHVRRRLKKGGEMRPDAHLFELFTASGSCPPDLAQARLGYRPRFGLNEGLIAAAAHLRNLADH